MTKHLLREKPQRTVKYYYLRFLRLRGDPRDLALGVATGVFIGITPTIPLHTILVLLLALVLRASKVAGLIASLLVSNPLTFFFQYYFSFRIGTALLQRDPSWNRVRGVLDLVSQEAGFWPVLTALGDLGRETLLVLLLGGVVLALPPALVSYFVSYRFFLLVRKRRMKKQLTLSREISEEP